MVFAWLASAATGMLMARYYKKTWTTIRPMGKYFWFRIHQLCMTLTLLLTLTAFAVILAERKGEPFNPEAWKKNPHAIVGIVCIICSCLQPVMAFFRPHPGTRFRWVTMAVSNTFLAAE